MKKLLGAAVAATAVALTWHPPHRPTFAVHQRWCGYCTLSSGMAAYYRRRGLRHERSRIRGVRQPDCGYPVMRWCDGFHGQA